MKFSSFSITIPTSTTFLSFRAQVKALKSRAKANEPAAGEKLCDPPLPLLSNGITLSLSLSLLLVELPTLKGEGRERGGGKRGTKVGKTRKLQHPTQPKTNHLLPAG